MTVNVTDNDTGTGNVMISSNMLAFDDTDGATGGIYTISLSHDPKPGKTVRVSLNLTNGNNTLQVNPTVVDFTNKANQTITVKRAGGASGMIVADVTVAISHTIETGTGYDPNITTFSNSRSTVNVTVASTIPADADHDGLIDIDTAEKLNNMRYNLAGTSYKTLTQTTGNTRGCPSVANGGCHGYELMVDINLLSLLDANNNGRIDTTTVRVAGKRHTVIKTIGGKDTSWVPVGTDATGKRFTGTFEGNNHTIANLWVNMSGYSGLFGVTGGAATIRNVGIISGSIHSSSSNSNSFSGSLVGKGTVTIINSYFSGGNVSSSSAASNSTSGGLVGQGIVTIINSYFSGGKVSSSSASAPAASTASSNSGGLVAQGANSGSVTITNSYFSGGDVSSSSSHYSYSGGLMGKGFGSSAMITIVNSYFSGGKVSSSSPPNTASYSGGLVGLGNSTITNGYWNKSASQTKNGAAQNPKRRQGDVAGTLGGLTLAQLKAITANTMNFPSPSDLPHSATDNTKAWDLGDASELPSIKECVPAVNMSTTPPTTDWTMCASYGTLLAGQR